LIDTKVSGNTIVQLIFAACFWCHFSGSRLSSRWLASVTRYRSLAQRSAFQSTGV
jgi:hypothetical protein